MADGELKRILVLVMKCTLQVKLKICPLFYLYPNDNVVTIKFVYHKDNFGEAFGDYLIL